MDINREEWSCCLYKKGGANLKFCPQESSLISRTERKGTFSREAGMP